MSSALQLETPSIKNCESRIQLHQVNIAKLEKQSKVLSKQIYNAMDKQSSWQKKFDAAKKNLPADQVGKISKSLKASEDALDAIIQSTIKINESIENANARHKKFQEAIKALKQGVPGWAGPVSAAVGLAVNAAFSVQTAMKLIETRGAGIIKIAHEIENIAEESAKGAAKGAAKVASAV